MALLTGLPSPKFHEYEAIDPSGSLDPAEEKNTSSGAWPSRGEPLAKAMGAWLPPGPDDGGTHADAASATAPNNATTNTRRLRIA